MSELNNKILNELIQIRRLLTVLSQDKLADFNNYVESTFLTTDTRKKMYEMFDGKNSFNKIADKVGVTSRGVSKFASQLEENGIVEFVDGEKGTKNPNRLF